MDKEEEGGVVGGGDTKPAPRSLKDDPSGEGGRNWESGKGPSSEEMEKEHGKGGYGAA